MSMLHYNHVADRGQLCKNQNIFEKNEARLRRMKNETELRHMKHTFGV
jgi:hypothetical protein